jgi:hypothetical protein
VSDTYDPHYLPLDILQSAYKSAYPQGLPTPPGYNPTRITVRPDFADQPPFGVAMPQEAPPTGALPGSGIADILGLAGYGDRAKAMLGGRGPMITSTGVTITPEDISRGIGLGMSFAGGGLATRPIRLVPDESAFGGYLGHSIMDEAGKTLGRVMIKKSGNTAHIDNIFADENPAITSDPAASAARQANMLGSGTIAQALRQYLEQNPEVTRFAGERVSGARAGGSGYTARGPLIEMNTATKPK